MKSPVKNIKTNYPILDIELVLGDLLPSEIQYITQQTPKEYFVEDRSKNGWGFVLFVNREYSTPINESVQVFFKPLKTISNTIAKYDAILRIAVYYSTFACTLKFDLKKYLTEFNVSMEISIYPTSSVEDE